MRSLTTGLIVGLRFRQKEPTGMCTESRGVSHKTNSTYDYFIHGWNLELGLSLVRGNGASSSPPKARSIWPFTARQIPEGC
jgi:hypothetical protein